MKSQRILQVRNHALVDLRHALGGHHGADAALAAARGEIQHGLLAFRLVLLRREQLALVDGAHERRPMFLAAAHQPLEESAHESLHLFHLHGLQAQDRRMAGAPQLLRELAGGRGAYRRLVAVVRQHQLVELVGHPLKAQAGFLVLNVKEPTIQTSVTLTPARPHAQQVNVSSSEAQAGVGTNPCLTNICSQRGALRATINAS